MTSFREIEPNRVRTQKQRSENRSWQRRSRRNAIGTEDRRNRRCRSGRHIGDHPSIRSGYLRGLRRPKQRDKRHCELVVRHSLASYAVENHRTPVTAVTSVGDFMIRIGRPKNIFRGDPWPGCGSTPLSLFWRRASAALHGDRQANAVPVNAETMVVCSQCGCEGQASPSCRISNRFKPSNKRDIEDQPLGGPPMPPLRSGPYVPKRRLAVIHAAGLRSG